MSEQEQTPFFITGLPRSRSGWLANLFCTDRTVCFHEPRAPIPELIAANPTRRVGVADSTLVLRHAGIIERWPEAPWLYVERPASEAMRSFVRFVRPHVQLLGREIRRFWTLHQQASARLLEHEKDGRVLAVQFGALERPEVVLRAWAHLVPEVECNPARLAVLMHLKIEQRIEWRIGEVFNRKVG